MLVSMFSSYIVSLHVHVYQCMRMLTVLLLTIYMYSKTAHKANKHEGAYNQMETFYHGK